jgi:hypothetical protein
MFDRYELYIYKQWLRVYMQSKMIKHNKDLFESLDDPLAPHEAAHLLVVSYWRLAAQRTRPMSVRAKSSPLNSSGSPEVRASAYAKRSPKFSPSGCLPRAKRR